MSHATPSPGVVPGPAASSKMRAFLRVMTGRELTSVMVVVLNHSSSSTMRQRGTRVVVLLATSTSCVSVVGMVLLTMTVPLASVRLPRYVVLTVVLTWVTVSTMTVSLYVSLRGTSRRASMRSVMASARVTRVTTSGSLGKSAK